MLRWILLSREWLIRYNNDWHLFFQQYLLQLSYISYIYIYGDNGFGPLVGLKRMRVGHRILVWRSESNLCCMHRKWWMQFGFCLEALFSFCLFYILLLFQFSHSNFSHGKTILTSTKNSNNDVLSLRETWMNQYHIMNKLNLKDIWSMHWSRKIENNRKLLSISTMNSGNLHYLK